VLPSRAVLAVVVLRQRRQRGELAAHRDPRHAIDRHGIGALRHHFLDRRDTGAGHAAQLRLRETLLHPAFLAAAGVVRDRDVGLVEIVDRLRVRELGFDLSPNMQTLVLE
jgi:hypothetical protein